MPFQGRPGYLRIGGATRLITIVALVPTWFCLAQDPGDFKPATSNVLYAQYPRVDTNSRVEIRFKAPDAGKVRVNFWSGPKADMDKQADGFWTVTTPPLAPGLHHYTVIVDGAEVSDPGSAAYFGGSKSDSAVEVPEAAVTYYLPQDVPHGQVREVSYHSKVTGTWRHALVYTPPAYDTQLKSATPCFTSSTAGAKLASDEEADLEPCRMSTSFSPIVGRRLVNPFNATRE